MKASRIALIISLIFLTLSIFFTFVPLIRGREGGCASPNSGGLAAGSAVYELARTGGKWEYLEPVKAKYGSPGNAEYGCSMGERNQVIPVDLYILTLLSGITAIVLSERKRLIRVTNNG